MRILRLLLSERWSLLPPHSQTPLISGEKVSDNYHMCPKCDSVSW
jgi:hypothetical protein